MTGFVLPLAERAAATPDEPAMRAGGVAVTWSEAADRVLRLAAALRSMPLGDARRVMVMARNRASTAVAHAAALLGEAASVPVNSRLTPAEVAYQIDESAAGLIVADEATAAVVAEAAAGRPIRVVVLPSEGVRGESLDGLIGDHPATVPGPDQRVIPSLLFTSGTTGKPKAVQLPPTTIGRTPTVAGLIEHVRGSRLARAGTHLVVGPMSHNGPLTAVRLLLIGVPLVIHEQFDAAGTLAAIESQGIESSVMVPTHFVRLLALPAEQRATADVSSLRVVVHTGGACSVDIKQRMLDWWGPVLYESYGGTESGTTCSIGPEEWLAHPGSVGRPVPPFEALILDEDGTELPVGAEGRLYFRDTTGRGIQYEGDPAKTAAAHVAPGVFTLGEIGKLDDDGYVYITDRFSDMVVSGGVNIYPAEVEQVLITQPDVMDVACIGLPDAEMGERLVAVVEIRAGSTVTDDDLRAWCKASLAGYKVPKAFHRADHVPRTLMGKIDKRALRATHTPS